ncbi:TRAP transporter substrate-binding protein [Hydrogenophaga sp.]|uniref:TRAP transporter substrate-binding protein n=1 Tax=Hydrogenophaga sp. TaxID=1904254 RepID=UPI0035684A0A
MNHTTSPSAPRLANGARVTKRAFLALGVCLAAASFGAASAETYELKVSHYLPPNHTMHKELERWAADLDKKSGGRLKLSIFPSGQMGPVTRQFDLARTGVADISFFLHGVMPGRFPLTELTQVPYAFNPDGQNKPLSVAQASAVVTSMAGRLAKEHEGTRVLYVIGQANIGLFFNKSTVRKPEDMKGMRIRHNGPLASKMINAWGATPAAVAPVELADALEKGVIDGMTFNYEAAQSFQMGSAVKHVTAINAYAATFGLVMNGKKYDALPADLRKLIDDTTGVEGARRVGALYDASEAAGRLYMLENKAELIEPTAEEAMAFRKPVMPLVDETIKATEDKGWAARPFYTELRTRVNAAK